VRLDLPAVTAALTTVPVTGADLAALAAAVRAQADLQAIRDLGILYGRAVDDHDIDTLVAMFTPDGVFERRGVAATGSAEIRAAYVASFDTYRTMLHTAHPGVVQLHGDGTASGWSHGHAELATRTTLVMASYRYEDELRCVEGRWLFARRSITFMYAVPADELATSFGDVQRMRWPRTAPEPGDYPETSPTWETYRG
jgi:uncharacterized protein (TIGR02246 family)